VTGPERGGKRSTDAATLAAQGFRTVFGHELVGELPAFVHRPYLVVTMADLWPWFEDRLAGPHLAGVHLVETLELTELVELEATLKRAAAIVGLGGGQALDVAKFLAWTRRLPLFQVPTATTVNAPFGHRAGLRDAGRVRYLGWAVPEAVYIDFEVIGRRRRTSTGRASATLCYHTARRTGLAHRWPVRARWPYDQRLLDDAATHGSVVDALDEIRAGSERGSGPRERPPLGRDDVPRLGWNHATSRRGPFVFYNLERITGRHFIHGQPVGLGIVAGSILQGNEPERMAEAIARAGVDIRPEAMGVSWDDVDEALRTLGAYVREVGLWFTVADVVPVTDEHVARLRELVERTFAREATA
jgi:hypothetical protein